MQSIPRRNMDRINGLRQERAALVDGKVVSIYARSAADDDAETACQSQIRRALELVEAPAHAAVYADANTSGLDADRPALRRLLADVRRGGVRCVIVRDLARLARNVTLLETILGEFRAADVELVTTGEGHCDA